MDEEFEFLLQNGTWELVELPPDRTPIKCKWVYKAKLRPDGSVSRHKARLVAKGYSQILGLEEEIYMMQPEGYAQRGREHLVCKLQRAIYGLKQSSRAWNQKFKSLLEKYELFPTEADSCVFVRMKEPKIICTIFVDDGLVACNDRKTIMQMMNFLKESLEITYGVLLEICQ
ncbi:hypothetical protein R1sor_017516 [Riccia sorocarpa]|uniref:Reverse transcriptase Ty1/copia-type domain-containing protein n=1 Tax=Riccia sorocarpa TaxID=122646 RepID=A0ABD3IAE9_9MARC